LKIVLKKFLPAVLDKPPFVTGLRKTMLVTEVSDKTLFEPGITEFRLLRESLSQSMGKEKMIDALN